MKLFFAIMLFAICLFSMPSTSSGSGSPPGQASFVAFQPSIDLPVMVANYEMTANYELTFVSYQIFEMADLPEKGGFVADQGLFLERQHLYLNRPMMKSTDNTNCKLTIRLCYDTSSIRNKNSQKNIISDGSISIRADTLV